MQSRFGVLEALVNEETISQNQETESAPHPETIVPILERKQNLAPKSRNMKKKPAIQQSKKYPSHKATALNLSIYSMTENIDPNTKFLTVIPTHISNPQPCMACKPLLNFPQRMYRIPHLMPLPLPCMACMPTNDLLIISQGQFPFP